MQRPALAVIAAAAALLLLAGALYLYIHTPVVKAKVWAEYVDRVRAGAVPFLADFSYAGYSYQTRPLPGADQNVTAWFDVTRYGVRPGYGYADEGVQKAIDAAEAAGGGVVYFPPGRYQFGGATGTSDILTVRSSNIVLRGAGPQKTILYLDKWQKGDRFLLKVRGESGKGVARVTNSLHRGTRQLQVDSTRRLAVGGCFRLRVGPAPQLLPDWFGSVPMDDDWVDIQKGITLDHPHCIASIDAANKIVSLQEPIHVDLPYREGVKYQLQEISPVTNVGVELLRFESGWGSFPKPLCHKCSEMMDTGWQAVGLYVARDSWVRDCVFQDWIQSVRLESSSAVTVANCTVAGKPGHHSFRSLRGYGNLFVDNTDTAGTFHGPSVQSNDVGAVFLRHHMTKGQSIDMHGELPTHTLLDSVVGGQLFGSGGKETRFPQHGLMMTLYNFKHRGGGSALKEALYRFWPIDLEDPKRFGTVYFKPVIVGLWGDRVEIDTSTVLHWEALGARVDPPSLFEAQVRLRLSGGDQHPAVLAPFVPGYDAAQGASAIDPRLTIVTDYHPKVVFHLFRRRTLRLMAATACITAMAALLALGVYWKFWRRRRPSDVPYIPMAPVLS